MKKATNYLLGFFLILFLESCAKDGIDGINGKDGTSIPGADGTKIHSGQEMPATNLGNIGDFYIDLKKGELFGPKDEKGWE